MRLVDTENVAFGNVAYLPARCVLLWGRTGWEIAPSRTPVSLFLFLAYFCYNLASHEVFPEKDLTLPKQAPLFLLGDCIFHFDPI